MLVRRFSLMTVFIGLFLSNAIASEHYINAKQVFGLVGDGQADDTAAIQKAFSAQGAVFIIGGTYRVTNTIKVRSGVRIYGAGGAWNPHEEMTRIIYDGPEGGIVLQAKDTPFVQVRQITLDGNHKANVGVYINYAVHETCFEDVAVVGTREHGFYITKTWYAHFNRIVARNNLGNGITIDRDKDPKLSAGPVNFVTFFQCKANKNGLRFEYDGINHLSTDYGFGSFGCNAAISVLACAFEQNGGPGVYVEGAATNMHFQSCYIEHNAQAFYHKYQELYGDGWLNKKDRTVLGRAAGIIENCKNAWSVVFDNCYVHPSSGVWLKGGGSGNPIEFRNMVAPSVVWSEHGNWMFVNSSRFPVSSNPGLIYRRTGDEREFWEVVGYNWWDPVGTLSGHPGVILDTGKRQIWPHPKEGLHLFIDAQKGQDESDGRTDCTKWKSIDKLTKLLSDTSLDIPMTIHLDGQFEAIQLKDITGNGSILIKCSADSNINKILFDNINLQIQIEGEDTVLSGGYVRNCPEVYLRGLRISPQNNKSELSISAQSSVLNLEHCIFEMPSDLLSEKFDLTVNCISGIINIADPVIKLKIHLDAKKGGIINYPVSNENKVLISTAIGGKVQSY